MKSIGVGARGYVVIFFVCWRSSLCICKDMLFVSYTRSRSTLGFLGCCGEIENVRATRFGRREGRRERTYCHISISTLPARLLLPNPWHLERSCIYEKERRGISTLRSTRGIPRKEGPTHFAPGKSCVLPPRTNTTEEHGTPQISTWNHWGSRVRGAKKKAYRNAPANCALLPECRR